MKISWDDFLRVDRPVGPITAVDEILEAHLRWLPKRLGDLVQAVKASPM
jgi:hypothetical protein